MRITDGARWAVEDSVKGQPWRRRARLWIAAAIALIQATIAPAELTGAPIVVAHESEVRKPEEVAEDG